MTDRPEESTIYWGDIHRSSTASGGKASMEQHFRVAQDELHLDFLAVADNASLTENPIKHRFYMEELKGPESATNGKTPEGLDRIMDLHQISSSDWEKLQRLVEIFSLHVTCPH